MSNLIKFAKPVLGACTIMLSQLCVAGVKIDLQDEPAIAEFLGVAGHNAITLLISDFGQVEPNRGHTLIQYSDGSETRMQYIGIGRARDSILIYFGNKAACDSDGERVQEDFFFDNQPIRGLRTCTGGVIGYYAETDAGNNFIIEKMLGPAGMFLFESPSWSSLFSNTGFNKSYRDLKEAL